MTEQRRKEINVVDARWNRRQLGCGIKWVMKINFFIGRTLNLENVHMGFILGGFKLDDYTQVAWSMCGFFLFVFSLS